MNAEFVSQLAGICTAIHGQRFDQRPIGLGQPILFCLVVFFFEEPIVAFERFVDDIDFNLLDAIDKIDFFVKEFVKPLPTGIKNNRYDINPAEDILNMVDIEILAKLPAYLINFGRIGFDGRQCAGEEP